MLSYDGTLNRLCFVTCVGLETSFEFDFPPGSDMMGEIQQGPHAEERMEAELLGRLHGLYDLFSPGPLNLTYQSPMSM